MEHGVETERLWRQMHDGLLSFIRRRVATVHDAEDILQDVFVRIHANLPRLRSTQSVTAWVYRITRNAITDHHRQRATTARAMARLAEGFDEADGSARNGGPSADVAREATDEFVRCLEPLLSELPEEYRQALEMTELNGATQKDAARQLGLSVSGMKSRVQRGRSRLKEVILDCCDVALAPRGGLLDYERRPGGKGGDCGCE
jgi:RNA polymerase sigma-70 factor (ECF subfamily)